jgi:hypothetical protein
MYNACMFGLIGGLKVLFHCKLCNNDWYVHLQITVSSLWIIGCAVSFWFRFSARKERKHEKVKVKSCSEVK